MTDLTRASAIKSVVEQFVDEELSHENAHIAGAVWNMLDAGGKLLRPRMTMAAGRAAWPAAPPDPVLAAYMELIHIATLIHDDVLDNAGSRRGRESTNHAHGNRFSVLAGDYLFSWVFKKVTQSYANPIPTILAAMLAEICNGEVKQLRAAGNAALPPSTYFEIIEKKTAELFAACAECGAIAALQHRGAAHGPAMRDLPHVRALRSYGYAFGIAFQIRDDLLDFTASEAIIGKPAGSDVREKKVTLPLIYAVEEGGARTRSLVEVLFAHADAAAPEAAHDLAAVIDCVRGGASPERTGDAISAYARRAEEALDVLPPSDARDELTGLARSLTEFSSAAGRREDRAPERSGV